MLIPTVIIISLIMLIIFYLLLVRSNQKKLNKLMEEYNEEKDKSRRSPGRESFNRGAATREASRFQKLPSSHRGSSLPDVNAMAINKPATFTTTRARKKKKRNLRRRC